MPIMFYILVNVLEAINETTKRGTSLTKITTNTLKVFGFDAMAGNQFEQEAEVVAVVGEGVRRELGPLCDSLVMVGESLLVTLWHMLQDKDKETRSEILNRGEDRSITQALVTEVLERRDHFPEELGGCVTLTLNLRKLVA
uniref:Uncharacterized protein n=1 Tax=Palpitomonas bilix TaxID=652834 RepID=A0A7S3DM08_9EUKA|mmetsp:Transcript_42749/g.110190  ORF Transcript_42749/g.110190 Transcript_42749/m.110190 type:complete len:141 (+) Transcript_42749:1-423(+)